MTHTTRMQGRVIRAGRAEGRALVSPEPIGVLGGVDPETGIVIEPSAERPVSCWSRVGLSHRKGQHRGLLYHPAPGS